MRRLHDSEAPAERPRPTPPQGIIPTGIEEQELHVHPAVLHPGEDPIGGDGMVFDIAGRTEARANRDEVVHVLDLHAMAREEEETRTAARYPVRKAVDGLFHGGLIGIPVEGDLKPEAAQEGGQVGGIVDGIAQRTVGIGSIADEYGPAVGRRRERGRGARRGGRGGLDGRHGGALGARGGCRRRLDRGSRERGLVRGEGDRRAFRCRFRTSVPVISPFKYIPSSDMTNVNGC